jgi:very-short-patch-repair endonuclease
MAGPKRAKPGPRGAIPDGSRIVHDYRQQPGPRGPGADAGRVVHAAAGGDPALATLATRQHGVVTSAQLRALAVLTRSEAEERLLALLRAAALPPTAVNARIGRHEVDLVWAPQRLVVEVDGFAYHGSRAAFERDRLRDAELQAAGYRVVRVTWRQLVERPEALIVRLAQALVRS